MSTVNSLSKSAYFQRKTLTKPSFFESFFGRIPKQNVGVVLHNMVCENTVTALSQQDVQTVLLKYKVNIRKEPYLPQIKALYRQFLRFVLADKRVSNLEIKKLNHLRGLLMLKPSETATLYEQEVVLIYHRTLDEMFQDQQLDAEEKETLKKLKNALQIPDALIKKIHAITQQEVFDRLVSGFASDERISNEEVQEMETLASSLDIKVNVDEPALSRLNRYRLYWQIENEPLPVLAVSVHLQRGESCHFSMPCVWNEYKSVTRSVRYGGPVLQFKIVRGVYWRRANYQFNRIKEEKLTAVDTGMLYLTNKRLLFVGKKNTRSLRLTQVVDFEPYTNGVEVKRAQGKTIFLTLEAVVDLFSTMLGQCIQAA